MIQLGDFFTIIQNLFIKYGVLNEVLQVVISFSPIILAYILFKLFWPLWLNYIRSDFVFSQKYVLLEIRLPREMVKSPLAMEVFLSALHNTSDGNKIAQYWRGEMRPQFSLEIVSIEGVVKFFIRSEDKRKNNVITTLYSQFPGIEVHEVPDYAMGVHFDPEETKVWGAEFKFSKPDPYPIKTYVDYGLEKDPKEEYKVDPLVPMIEFLGSLGFNQQVWIQYIIRGHKKDKVKPGHIFKMTDSWRDEAQKIINEIMLRDSKTKVSGVKDDKTGLTKLPSITSGEQDVVKVIERSLTKIAFDVGIRALYIGKKDFFDKGTGVGGIMSSLKQFGSEHLNSFVPNGKKLSARLSGYPWEDYKNIRANRQSKMALEAYKRRCFFTEPFEGDPIVMTSEELATVFHFPGEVAATPNLNRIPSKKAQAPSNLPI